MNCPECKQILFPQNPEVPQFDPSTKTWLAPLCEGCPNACEKKELELKNRVSNLEEISAQPGRIPRQYFNEFQQIRGELAYLRNKLYEQRVKPGKKPVLSQGVKV